MDADDRKIWELFGSLSDAFWRRSSRPGVSILDALLMEQEGPIGEEEGAIWDELTAPANYAALVRYADSSKQSGVNGHAVRLYESVLARARRRFESARSTSGPSDRVQAADDRLAYASEAVDRTVSVRSDVDGPR